MRAVRGGNRRLTRDFHHSPPKRVNYGEGENRVKVNFHESPHKGGKFTGAAFALIQLVYFGLASPLPMPYTRFNRAQLILNGLKSKDAQIYRAVDYVHGGFCRYQQNYG